MSIAVFNPSRLKSYRFICIRVVYRRVGVSTSLVNTTVYAELLVDECLV